MAVLAKSQHAHKYLFVHEGIIYCFIATVVARSSAGWLTEELRERHFTEPYIHCDLNQEDRNTVADRCDHLRLIALQPLELYPPHWTSW